MEIKKLTLETIINLHNDIIEESGGDSGILNSSAIEFALSHINYNNEVHDFFNNIALLMRNIISQHPFIDGNKRTGLMITLSILNDNNLKLNLTDKQKEELVLDIAQGKFNEIEKLSEFLMRNCGF